MDLFWPWFASGPSRRSCREKCLNVCLTFLYNQEKELSTGLLSEFHSKIKFTAVNIFLFQINQWRRENKNLSARHAEWWRICKLWKVRGCVNSSESIIHFRDLFCSALFCFAASEWGFSCLQVSIRPRQCFGFKSRTQNVETSKTKKKFCLYKMTNSR